jgi:hypothetical protein
MLEHDIEPDAAEGVFRRKFRQKLAARGYQGADLEQKIEELMNAPVRFRLDLQDEPPGQDQP